MTLIQCLNTLTAVVSIFSIYCSLKILKEVKEAAKLFESSKEDPLNKPETHLAERLYELQTKKFFDMSRRNK